MNRPEDTLTADDLYSLRLRYHERGTSNRPLTQARVASWLGINANSYARLERGDAELRTSLARLVIYSYAEFCDVSLRTVRASIAERRDIRARYTAPPQPEEPKKRRRARRRSKR